MIAWTEVKSPYGVRFLFTGREWLAPLGLYDYRHRAYSPSLGGFLQRDPNTFAGGDVNFCPYCASNPAELADHAGLSPDAHRYKQMVRTVVEIAAQEADRSCCVPRWFDLIDVAFGAPAGDWSPLHVRMHRPDSRWTPTNHSMPGSAFGNHFAGYFADILNLRGGWPVCAPEVLCMPL